MPRYLFFTRVLLLLFILASNSLAAPTKKTDELIHITSNQMEAMDKEGKVVFKGNVVAKKGGLTIYSDVLTVYYQSKKGSKGKERRALKRLIAKGNVKIIQGNKTAKGKIAIYDKDMEVIQLSGNAQVWQGKNTVKGNKITFYINEDKSIVESAPGKKVEAVVFSGEQ